MKKIGYSSLILVAILLMYVTETRGEGLVSYWKLDDKILNTAMDSRGSNDGSVTGASINQAGIVASAFSFDGINDYVILNSENLENITGNFTVEAWYKRNSKDTSSADAIMGNYYYNSDMQLRRGWALRHFINSDKPGLVVIFTNDTETSYTQVTANASSDLSINQWYHIAGVVDFTAGTVTLYIDGVSVGTASIPFGYTKIATSSSYNFMIGLNPVNNGYFHGLIDDVRIYDEARTQTEIQAHSDVADNLLIHLPLDGDAADYSGNNNDGIMTNFASSGIYNGGTIWSTEKISQYNYIGDELLTNPSFDTTTTGWSCWVNASNVDVTSGRTDLSNEYDTAPAGFKIDYTESGLSAFDIQLFTDGLNIVKSKLYLLTFRAKATDFFTISRVRLQETTSPWSDISLYEKQNQNLEIGTNWKEYKVAFTAGITDNNARIVICLGNTLSSGETFFIDTLSFREFGKKDLVGSEKISNPSFDIDSSGWSTYGSIETDFSASTSTSDYDSYPACYYIDCTSNGSSISDMQFFNTSGMSIVSGKEYKLSFRAKCTSSFILDNVKLMKNSSPWSQYSTANPARGLTIGSDWETYEIIYKANTTTSNAKINFFMGDTIPELSTFYIDTISFKECVDNELLVADIGNIRFNNEPPCGVKRWAVSSLAEQGDYFYDRASWQLYLFSKENPADYYTDIDIMVNEDAVLISDKAYVIIENLDLRDNSGFGISCIYVDNIIVRNCDFSFLGGGDLFCDGESYVRAGNAVEFYNDASNCLVEGCVISDIYDTALTNQSMGACRQNNIEYKNNVMWNVCWGIEIWIKDPNSELYNITARNNTVVNSGKDWGYSQRPVQNPCDVNLLWGPDPEEQEAGYEATSVIIEDNIFYNARNESLVLDHPWGWEASALTLDYNNYYKSDSTSDVVQWIVDVDLQTFDYYNLSEFSDYQTNTGKDSNSITSDPDFVDEDNFDFRLNTNSPALTASSTGSYIGAFDSNGNMNIGTTPTPTGTIYYVDATSGDDYNNGTSTSTPWETLEKVNSKNLYPGDAVYFKRGEKWRGSLFPQSGDSNDYIVYGAYGTGAKPIIHYSIQNNDTEDWTVDDSFNGRSLIFDGSSSYISLSPYSSLLVTGDFTAEAWYKRSSKDTSNADAIMGNYYWNSDMQLRRGWALRHYVDADKPGFVVVFTNDTETSYIQVTASASSDLSINQWYHIAGVVDFTARTVTLYIDGVSVGTASIPSGYTKIATSSPNLLYVGFNPVNNGYFHGEIDDVKIYDRPLSSTELTDQYESDEVR